jgi:hypothetical protein
MQYLDIMGRVPCGSTVYEVKWEIPNKINSRSDIERIPRSFGYDTAIQKLAPICDVDAKV